MRSSVIIPSVNRPKTLLRLLECLARQTILPDQVIITEQGGFIWDAQNIPEVLQDRFLFLPLVVKSLTMARQAGVKHAFGDIIFFFDDDIIIRNDYIEKALDYFCNHTSCCALGGVYSDPVLAVRSRFSILIGRFFWIYSAGRRNKILLSGWGDYVREVSAQVPTRADWLFGCNMCVRAQVFQRISFETRMKTWCFLEDLFLGAQMIHFFGSCMMILPDLSVIHDPTETTGAISKSTLRMRIVHRYLFWRLYIWPDKWYSLLPFILGMIANLLLMLRQKKSWWIIFEHLKTWCFLASHINLRWDDANSFIFDQD